MLEESDVSFERMRDEDVHVASHEIRIESDADGSFPTAPATFIGGGSMFNADWVGEKTASASPSPKHTSITPTHSQQTQTPNPTFEVQTSSNNDTLNGGLPVDTAPTPIKEEEDIDTLDEPVITTIWRELKGVGIKLFHVLAPHGKGPAALRDWDLWGPLILCFALEAFLAFGNHNLAVQDEGEHTLVFTVLWTIIWVGSVSITINSTLLGGNLSFFQSVSLIGYCLFPLTLAAFVATLWPNVWWRLGSVCLGVLWSIGASLGFLTATVPENRRVLALYPVFLFYSALGWFIFWVLGGATLEDSSSTSS